MLAAMSQPPVRDPRVRDLLMPVRVLWQQGPVDDADVLLTQTVHQTGLPGRRCTLRGGAAVLLDFGRELHGGVQITVHDTTANRPVTVRVRFGESASEAMADPFPVHGHAIHDQRVQLPWWGSTEVGGTGFRFVRIDLPEADPAGETPIEAKLVSVRALHLHRDLPWRGAFRCPDERLNRIWQVGAETVHLCLQDLVWDGIKRDRLVWIGDLHPEMMVVATVFGAVDVVPRSLDFVRDHTPLPGWMNGPSSYSLWWAQIQCAWWRYTGDRAYLEQQRAYLLGLMDQILADIGADGVEQLTGWRFLDWPTARDPAAIHAGLQALAVLALDAGAVLGAVLGESALVARCQAGAARLRAYRPPPVAAKQANALQALAGILDPAEVERTVLAVDPCAGLSTFYGYYVLQARAQAGKVAEGLEVIRRYWGGMLDLGATTFWEDFDLAWTPDACGIDRLVPPGMKDIHGDFGDHCYKGFRHSLCHGWAAGPTAWLSEHVLGITPLEPGFRRVRVAPRLGGLAWAEGSFPTPHGDLHVRHEARPDGTVHSVIDAPPGVTVERDAGCT